MPLTLIAYFEKFGQNMAVPVEPARIKQLNKTLQTIVYISYSDMHNRVWCAWCKMNVFNEICTHINILSLYKQVFICEKSLHILSVVSPFPLPQKEYIELK